MEMNCKKLFLTLSFLAFMAVRALSQQSQCTVIVASDLHFDMPPETDQYYHVVAMNHLSDSIHVDGVLLAGDIFDKAHPEIQALYRQRYERGVGPKTLHMDAYPCYGNHDISPESGRPALNRMGYELNMHYMDSLLQAKLRQGAILNVDPSSRAYSLNISGVHFIMGQLAAGDTTYCKDNFEWLQQDLERYCADGTPVVYIQHYGFDRWARDWWPEKNRRRLFKLLDRYRLAAFLVGHTHEASIQKYRGHHIYQVNNAWPDEDGPASFALLKICGDEVDIQTVNVLDGKGTIRIGAPELHTTIKKPVK